MSILVCDDHQMFLSALVEALESQGHEVAAYTPDPNRILELAELHHPALVLLDVHMPGMTGIELARRLREHDPRIAILLLTASTEDWVRAAFDARAVDGLVRKQSGLQALDAAIRRVLAGERTAVDWPLRTRPTTRTASPLDDLTARERQVLSMLTEGASTTAMAERLCVSTNTVRSHVRSVLLKLGVHHRTKAAHAARELGLTATV
jgi:DNA-binding NarL/FixJ family response regulator